MESSPGNYEHTLHDFATACKGIFKEGKEQVVKLPEGDEDAIDAMVQCVYTGSYSTVLLENNNASTGEMSTITNRLVIADTKPVIDAALTAATAKSDADKNETDTPLTAQSTHHPCDTVAGDKVKLFKTHARTFILAEKYVVSGLGDMAQDYFQETVNEHPDCVLTGWFQEASRMFYSIPPSISESIRGIFTRAVARSPDCFDQSGGTSNLRLEHPESRVGPGCAHCISGHGEKAPPGMQEVPQVRYSGVLRCEG